MKEYNQENIDFWSACDHYHHLENVTARMVTANKIIGRHISPGSPDPINIDFDVRQSIYQNRDLAEPELFVKAQAHIYNLMLHDSFPRFKKSELFKDSLIAMLD